MQGLIEFATLIEQADPKQRSRILTQAEKEDPEFISRVMRKVVYFEELIYLDGTVLAAILAGTSPTLLAYALKQKSEDFRKLVLKQLGYREMRQFMEEDQRIGVKASAASILGAQKQILKIARLLESKNLLIMEVADCPRFHVLKPRIKSAM